MDYIVNLIDLKPFEVKDVVGIEVVNDVYYLVNENNETLLTVPKERVRAIVSKTITEV